MATLNELFLSLSWFFVVLNVFNAIHDAESESSNGSQDSFACSTVCFSGIIHAFVRVIAQSWENN